MSLSALIASIEKPSEGENVTVRASLSCPISLYQYRLDWYVNGELVVESNRKLYRFKPKLNIYGTEATLEMSKLSSKDEGALVELKLYDLKQKKELISQSLKFGLKLKLLNVLQAAKFIFLENSPGELNCELNKKPRKAILFKEESKVLTEFEFSPKLDNERVVVPYKQKYEFETLKSADGSYYAKIKINQLQPGKTKDAGKYWIEFDDAELTTNEAVLNVKEIELEFTENIKTSNKTPLEGIQPIEIEFKLNKKVPTSQLLDSEIEVIYAKAKTVDKKMFNIEENDFGYKIIMKNPASLVDSGVYNLKLTSSQNKSPNSLQFDVTSKNLFSLELPETLEVFVDETIKLEVKTNQPIFTFQWYKNSEKLYLPSSSSSKQQQLSYIFSVKSAKLSDTGIYKFVCEDQFSSADIQTHSKCNVTVKERPEKLTKALGDLRVKEGDIINLSAKFDKPIDLNKLELHLNNEKLKPNTLLSSLNPKINFNPNTAVLSIQFDSAQTSHQGKFKLKTPHTECECQVTVEEKPLKFIKELDSVRLKILPQGFAATAAESEYSNEACFGCELSKPPSAFEPVIWLINDKQVVSDGDRFKVESLENGHVHKLTMSTCTLADSGAVVTVKVNAKTTSLAKLKVDQVPVESLIKIRKSLEDTRVKESEAASFGTELQLNHLYAGKALNVKWFRDGQELSSQSEKLEISQELDLAKLILKSKIKILNCQPTDQAEYSFKLVELDLKQPTSAKLYVKESEAKILRELPSTLTLTEGEPMHIDCEISKPNQPVEWSKDTQPLTAALAASVKSENLTYSLDIAKLEANHSGKYRISLKLGLSSECRVIVKPPPITITSKLTEKISVREGEKVTLECQFSRSVTATNSLNNPKIEWIKNGKRLYFSNKSPKYKLNLSETGKVELTVLDCVLHEDSGVYELRLLDASNDSCLLVQFTELVVLPFGVKITEPLSKVSVAEFETAKLTFRTSKVNAPNYLTCSWFHVKKEPSKIGQINEKLLADSNLFTKLDPSLSWSDRTESSFTLTLPDIHLEQAGFYMAVLVDSFSSEENSEFMNTWCKLVVNQTPVDISIKFPDSATVKKGEKLRLNCLLSKRLPANLSALKNRVRVSRDELIVELSLTSGQESQGESRYRLIDNLDRQLTFQIESSEMPDAGKYTLSLDNKKTSCQVKVIEDDAEIKSLSPLSSSPKIVKDLSTAPAEHLTTEPFSISIVVEAGDEASLKAEWFHDEKKVVPLLNQFERVRLENGQFSFKFNFVTPFVADSGLYSCRVSNSTGSVESKNASIQIKDPNLESADEESLFHTKPRFIEYFSDVYMEPGQGAEAQFKCKIIGKPEPKIVWHCNCHKITADGVKFELIQEANFYTLIVKNVNMNDEGEYTCRAINVKGETSWSANLYLNEASYESKVTSKTEECCGQHSMVAPNFLRKIKDSTVGEGGTACFDCFVDGSPFPAIKWFRNNVPLDLSKGKYELDVEADTGRVGLSIFKCSEHKEDHGEYTIRLENAAGVSQSNAYLCIEAPPSASAAEDAEKAANKNKRKVILEILWKLFCL